MPCVSTFLTSLVFYLQLSLFGSSSFVSSNCPVGIVELNEFFLSTWKFPRLTVPRLVIPACVCPVTSLRYGFYCTHSEYNYNVINQLWIKYQTRCHLFEDAQDAVKKSHYSGGLILSHLEKTAICDLQVNCPTCPTAIALRRSFGSGASSCKSRIYVAHDNTCKSASRQPTHRLVHLFWRLSRTTSPQASWAIRTDPRTWISYKISFAVSQDKSMLAQSQTHPKKV